MQGWMTDLNILLSCFREKMSGLKGLILHVHHKHDMQSQFAQLEQFSPHI